MWGKSRRSLPIWNRAGTGLDRNSALALVSQFPALIPCCLTPWTSGRCRRPPRGAGLSGSYRVEHNNCSLHAHRGSARCRRIDSAWADCHAGGSVTLPIALRTASKKTTAWRPVISESCKHKQPGGGPSQS